MARRRAASGKGRKDIRYEHAIPGRDAILAAMEKATGPMRLDLLGAAFGIHAEQHRRALEQRLKAMVRDGQIIRNRAGEYGLVKAMDLVAGSVQAHRDGYGFLRPDDGGDDVYLPAREMRTLWDGDRVAVRPAPGRGEGREGRVVEILARAKTFIVGQFRRERGINYVLEHGDERTEVLIGRNESGGAKPGDVVRVEVLEYPTERNLAIGRVVEIVGHAGQPGVETDIAILAHGVPGDWPDSVVAAAAAIPSRVPTSAKQGRKDLRSLPLVTIDGADARDFDDAVYCEPRGGGWRLIVAIADVSFYVENDTVLDREARARGTSVYFPDRVVPMLPEALSNGLCSLNPKVDRLCLACEMHVSGKGHVTQSSFYEGVMRSAARLTYSQAWEMLKKGARERGHSPFGTSLENLHAVYRAFAKARKRRGAIDFDLPETKIKLDDRGDVSEVKPVHRLVTHKIIEECMIAANVEAAKLVRKSRLPSLYRVHEPPSEDRFDELSLFLKTFDLSVPPAGQLTSQHLSRLIESVQGRPEAELIETVLLRSMMQAHYQPKNVGHFGLALDAYAHFTSPIRRYPDLLVHRTVKWWVEHRKPKGFGYSQAQMEKLGELCSRAERRADEAVWDVEEQLKCRYMQQHVGDEFDVIVSSVVPFGLFVRIPELQVDGLVHVSALPRDYYHRGAGGTELVGERTGTRFRLTDELRVRLAHVSLEERKIDFVPVDADAAGREDGRVRKRRRRRG